MSLLLLLAACGTTVSGGYEVAPRPNQDFGGGGGGGAANPSEALPGVMGAPSGPTVGATAPSTRVLGPSQGATTFKDPLKPSELHPGLKPLLIGVEVESDGAATRAAFGIENSPTGDPKAIYRAVADFLNARGGIAGHKVEFVLHFTDLKEGSFDQQGTRACSTFAEDHRVWVAISGVTRSTALQRCLTKHKIPLFMYRVEGQLTPEEFGGSNADYMYLPLGLNYQHAAALVDGLVRQGFFSKGFKLGLLTGDNTTLRRMSKEVWRPALARHNIPVTEEFFFYAPPDLSGISQTSADISSAVLRFKTAGITHVLFTDTGGGGPLLFQPAAESQQYYPRYGMGSFDFPLQLTQTSPESQLRLVQGISWVPAAVSLEGLPPLTPGQKACKSVVERAGASTKSSSQLCDPFFMLDMALRGVPAAATVSPQLLRQGMESLGRRFKMYLLWETVFEPGRTHDGAGAYYDFKWFEDCGCFKHFGVKHAIR